MTTNPLPPAPVVLRLTDDTFIKAILVEHGKASDLEPPPEWEAEHPRGYHLNCIWYDGDSRTIYAVRRYIGHERPEDNGYQAIFFRRDAFPAKEAEAILEAWMKENKTGPSFFEEYREDKPENS